MDKSTIRVYGWIVIAVIVAGVIISSMAMFADDVLQSLHILPENIENRYESGLPAGAVGSLNTPENLNLSEDYIFSFDAVPGADRYVVTIESNGVTTLKTTSSTFVDCAVELDTIKSYATIAVKAVSSSPDVKDSETAVYFIIRTLGVTSNIQLDSDYLLTFSAVDFANRYTIKIDGVTVCTTDTTSVSLAEYLSDKKGSVDISVIADDATGKYFSGEEAKLRVTLTYTVQYISNGSTIKTEYVKVALPHSHASFNLHSLSDTDDQAFRGWENEGETYEGGSYVTITSDVTYTAKWVNVYTIEFKVNGETISEIITEGDVEIPAYTPDENHEFDGWKAGDTIYAPGEHVQFTEDTILDAVLVPIYDVTIKYNDGTTSDTSYTTRGSVTLPVTPTRSGYYFLGWNDGVSAYQAGNVHVISKDTTYTAVWGKICSVPSVGGSLVYNGGVQSPNWLNLDASAITVGGQTSATNAGVYVTTFTPNSGFVWNDGTATIKSISWEIAKANGSVTLSATSGTITYPGEGNFTAAGTGTLSVESSDTAIATANVADGKITVVPGTTAGTATITVTSAATTNYKAATATYTVTVKLGTLNVSAEGYSGAYDGSSHSIKVLCSGATITYATTENGTYSSTNPAYTNAGTYTVYYKVSKAGYNTVTGSKTVVINKITVAVPKQSGALTYTGAAQSPVWDANYNNGKMTLGGTTSGTNAGTYTATFTLKDAANYQWSDGSTAAKSVTWTIGKKTISITVPAQSGSLTYTGSAQSPTWNANYDSSKMTLGGSTSGTNAGSYTATFTLKTATNYTYKWSDGTTAAKSATWMIGKKANTLSLSATSGTITYPTQGSFTISSVSGGAISISSSNNAIATVSVSDGKVTITPGTTAGTATITITSAATTNYKAATATYTVTVKLGTLNVTANGYSGTYDGSAHSISVSCSGATIKYGTASGSYTLTTNPTYKNAGTYTVYYQVSKPGYTTVTGSKTVVINKAVLAVPKQSGSLTYTGSAQSPAWDANYDSGKMTLGGTTSGTNAGTYTATFTLKDAANYQWSDGTTAAKSVTWTIGKKTVSLTVPAQSGSLTYTGSAQSPTWNANYDSGKMTLGATTSGTNAGSYTATFTLKTATNYTYKWSDGTTAAKSVTWTIGKKTVSLTVPAQSGSLTYTGSAQSPAWNANYDSGKMTLGGTTSGTNAGSYTAKFTLKTATNYTYKWSDGTTAAKSVTWTIGKKSNTLKLSATSGSVNYNGTGTFTVSTNTSGGALSVTSSNTTVCTVSISGTTITLTGKQAGTATITVTSAATTNYKAATATYTVTVNKVANTLKLSATSGSVNYNGTGTFIVSTNTSGGALSVTSSNTTVCTVSISGTTITLTGKQAGTATITVTSAATTNYKAATATYTVTVNKIANTLKLSATSGSINYNGTGTFTVSTNTSGGALSVTSSNTTVCAVSISGTTITLTGKQAGTATITVTSAATTNYKAATATYTVTVNKIANTLSLSATSGTITYPNQGSFSVTSNTSGGALSVKSSNTAIATVSISNGKVTIVPGTTAGTATITVTSAATTNYKTATATYKVTVKLGSLPPLVSASGYFGTYDGSPHGITVTCDGATIKYGTTEGEYPLTNSPTFTDVPTDGTGRYVVYFQVSKPGYETYTSSLPVVISRAPIAVKPSQHGTLLYNGTRLTPAWDNFNSSQLTIGGVTSAIDAGTYRASFTPTSNYKWSDGSTGSYSVFWTIDSEPAPGWYFPEQWEALWRGESVAPEYPWGWLNGDYLFVDNGTTYGDTDYIGGDLEDGMLAFPSDGTVTCIGAYGFANLGNLCGVYIPSTITTIEEFAFDFCENIYDFRIAKGLKYLEGPLITCGGATIVDEITYYGTIADWRSIAKDPTWTKGLWKTDIVCTDGNVLKPGLYVDGEYVETWDHLEQRSWVTLTNSVLTGVDFSYYDAYSENVHLVMDDSVTAISNSAFSQNSCITGITISNRVTELQSFVFGRCASLKAIVIPDSVTVLGNAVFDDTSLESIIYKGTIQDWKNIDMGIWWESNYDLPIDRITCLDGYIYRVKFLSGYSTTATYWLENGEKVPYVEVDNDAIDSNYWFSFDSWFYGTTEYIGDADMTYLISVTTDKNGNAVKSNLIVNQPITLTAATYKIVNIIAKDIKNSEYICDQIVLPSSNLTGTLPSEVNVEGWLVTGFYRTNSSGTKVNYSLGGNFTLSSTDSATVDIYCNQRSTRVMIAWYFHIYESYNSTTYKTKDGPYYEYIDPSVTPYLHQSNWGKKYSELNPNMSIDYEKMYTKKPTAYKYGQQQSFTSKTGATSTSWLDGYYLDLSQHKGAFVEVYVPVYPRFQHFNLVLNDDDTNTNTYYTFKLNYGAETFSFQGQLYDGTVPADIFDGFCVTTAWYPNPSNSHTSGIAPSTTFSRTYNIEPGVTNYMLIEGYWERSGMYVPGTGTQIMSWSEMKNMGLVLDSKLSTLLFDLGDLHFLPITEWWDALMNDKSIINMDFKFDADAAFAGSKNTLYGFLKYCEDNGITRNGYKITTDLMFDLYIPEDSNLKTVAPWACAFTNAKAVYLPSTVTNIGDGAFTHCYFLNQLTLPSGLVNLGKGAFSFSQLNRVEIPAGVKTIPNDAFSGCTSLEYVTFLGNNVMSIGDRAFMYCESLKTITTKTTANALPSSLETIGAQAFCLCQNMTKLTIPARVTTIGMYAFALWDMPDYFTPFGVQIGTADGAFCGITIKDNYAGAGKGTTIRFEGVPIWGFPLGMMAFNTATIETAATILDWTAFMSWKTVIPWADYRGTSVVCSNGKFPIKYFI